MHKVSWLATKGGMPFDKNFAEHYEWLLLRNAPEWLISTRRPSLTSRTLWMTHSLRWKLQWLKKRRIGGNHYYLKQHSRFPNPHIRSNVFAINREILLNLTSEHVISKKDAYAFESGKNSISRRLSQKSLRLLVVNSEGQTFDVPDWVKSKTFRLGDQELLLASDNQSQQYALSGPYERGILTMITWGLDAVIGNKPPLVGLLEFTKSIASMESDAEEQQLLATAAGDV
jgi:hypothetical protein